MKMKRSGKHKKNCGAVRDVHRTQRITVWTTPQLEDEQVFYVCADPDCQARLLVLDLNTIELPAT